jgi:hypothetical protein
MGRGKMAARVVFAFDFPRITLDRGRGGQVGGGDLGTCFATARGNPKQEAAMTNPLDEVASKAMGGVKAAKATIEGLSGVFRKLAQEHGEVSALLLHVKMSSDPKVRDELFPKIRRELLSHEKAEREVVYPALRAHAATQLIADKHDKEAGELEKVIAELTSMSTKSEGWTVTFDALVDLVQRHVAEEEHEFFPAGARVLGSQTETLLAQYESVKAEGLKLV